MLLSDAFTDEFVLRLLEDADVVVHPRSYYCSNSAGTTRLCVSVQSACLCVHFSYITLRWDRLVQYSLHFLDRCLVCNGMCCCCLTVGGIGCFLVVSV